MFLYFNAYVFLVLEIQKWMRYIPSSLSDYNVVGINKLNTED